MDNPSSRRSTRLTVGLMTAVALLVSACSSSGSPSTRTVTKTAPNGSVTTGVVSPGASTKASSTAPAAAPVHIKLLNSDGATYGVGMPIIAFFSKKITSGKALQDATKTTVDGQPLNGAWFFEYSSYYRGYPIEAHWRPKEYWPAHAKVHVDIPTKGLAAGKGLVFDDSLTLDFSTGARNLSSVDETTHKITVTSDGKPYGVFPVSLGSHRTPTTHGVKVIMEKGRDIPMRGPGYYDAHVKFTQRLTYSGEYLHSAPWNVSNIHNGVDSSNGCTNLLPSDAQRLYHFLQVGDVVDYPNANGPAMQMGSGYGDWNVNWGTWQSGGLVSTTA